MENSILEGNKYGIANFSSITKAYKIKNGVIVFNEADSIDRGIWMKNGFTQFLSDEILIFKNKSFYNAIIECIDINESGLKDVILDTPFDGNFDRQDSSIRDVLVYAGRNIEKNELLQQLFIDEFSYRYADLLSLANELREISINNQSSEENIGFKQTEKLIETLKAKVKGNDKRALWFMAFYLAYTADDKYGYFPYQIIDTLIINAPVNGKNSLDQSPIFIKVFNYFNSSGMIGNSTKYMGGISQDPDLDAPVFLGTTLAKKCLNYRIRLLARECGVEKENLWKHIYDEMVYSANDNTMFIALAAQFGLTLKSSRRQESVIEDERNIESIKNAYQLFFFAMLEFYLSEKFPDSIQDFTKIDLMKNVIPRDEDSIKHEIAMLKSSKTFISLCSELSEWRLLYDIHSIKTSNIETHSRHGIESFEGIVHEKNRRIQELEQALAKQHLSVHEKDRQIRKLQNQKDYTNQIEDIKKENKLLHDQLREKIAQIEYRDEYIEQLEKSLSSNNDDSIVDIDLSADRIAELAELKILFVCHDINSTYPEIKKVFPKAIIVEKTTDNISDVQVEGVIIVTSHISHALFYKIKSFLMNQKDIIVMYYNHKNMDLLCKEAVERFMLQA